MPDSIVNPNANRNRERKLIALPLDVRMSPALLRRPYFAMMQSKRAGFGLRAVVVWRVIRAV